jgi:hypothetical protein
MMMMMMTPSAAQLMSVVSMLSKMPWVLMRLTVTGAGCCATLYLQNGSLGLGSWAPSVILVFWIAVALLIVISQVGHNAQWFLICFSSTSLKSMFNTLTESSGVGHACDWPGDTWMNSLCRVPYFCVESLC